MTWVIRHGDGTTGILDLPMSIVVLVCDAAGCGWRDLEPDGQPGHLLAVIAGSMSHVTDCSFDNALLIVARKTLAEALDYLEVVDGGPD